MGRQIDISIVSHGHGALVLSALKHLQFSLGGTADQVRVWVTLNLPEPELESSLAAQLWPFELQCVRNAGPLGFGANHNQAHARASAAQRGNWFLVMNPDILWPENASPFWKSLMEEGAVPPQVGMVCPTQVDVDGHRQDFTRTLVTPLSLLARVIRRVLGLSPTGVTASVESAQWVNGACMLFRAEAFEALRGFDERYFMYCEDCDMCLRLQLAGWSLCSAPVTVIHDAQRATGRSLRHLGWHLRSLLRLWCSATFWRFLLRAPSRRTAA